MDFKYCLQIKAREVTEMGEIFSLSTKIFDILLNLLSISIDSIKNIPFRYIFILFSIL